MIFKYITVDEWEDGGVVMVNDGINMWPLDISTPELEQMALAITPEALRSFDGYSYEDIVPE